MMSEETLLNIITEYIEKNIFKQHMAAVIRKHSKLREYKINPIVVKYLSKVLVNDYTPEAVAKALYYPRVLGTSINTSFGTSIQKMFVILGIAEGSVIPGMDIEFIDKIDGRKKWCQLKSGPNTINSGDVKPMIEEFSKTIRLARTNTALQGVSNNDFVVGVLYGDTSQLSRHYKIINDIHPVFIGRDFWYRLTGFQEFYDKLVVALHITISNLEANDFFNEGLNQLTDEVTKSDLFEFDKL
ncbi:restriction endonuclease [Flavobacterium sp. Sd200]|uniref:PmeII family type II restriction endonuclease n=1 Tax=Flavobacterium sp. Sd200 TaxID=2692211 RepID=UPI00136B1355|nr:PmeII family type II restriction endonuclease [Flavobacterium sp. Sd200]MXN92697.1 restriction endonuclease [Flavobacterium sp. Sd200]